MTTYKISSGRGQTETADLIDEAWEIAWVMAMTICQGLNNAPEPLDEYHNGCGERGVCPAYDDGAYWPHIETIG